MKEDLALYGKELNYATAIWSAAYVFGQIPSNLLLTRVGSEMLESRYIRIDNMIRSMLLCILRSWNLPGLSSHSLTLASKTLNSSMSSASCKIRCHTLY